MPRGFKDEDASDEGVDVGEVQLVKETNLAILISMLDTGTEIWVPKSVLIADPGSEGSVGVLVLKTWWHDQHWDGVVRASAKPQAKPEPKASKAIGVSDLAQVQKLLEGKGITRIDFMQGSPNRTVRIESEEGGLTGKDLTEVVRALDKARRE